MKELSHHLICRCDHIDIRIRDVMPLCVPPLFLELHNHKMSQNFTLCSKAFIIRCAHLYVTTAQPTKNMHYIGVMVAQVARVLLQWGQAHDMSCWPHNPTKGDGSPSSFTVSSMHVLYCSKGINVDCEGLSFSSHLLQPFLPHNIATRSSSYWSA